MEAVDTLGHELLAARVDPMHREREADLMQTRWFDYADMHPAAATLHYAETYKQQTIRFFEMCVDIRTVEDARAFTPDNIFHSRDLTAMWLARGAADALGVPYDFVMEFAQKRALDRYFHRFPRPNQLYGEEFELDLADAWRDTLARSIRYSRIEKCKAGCGPMTPLRERHANFVVAQIKGRLPVQHRGMLARMFREAVLTPAVAYQHFDEGLVDAALALASRLG